MRSSLVLRKRLIFAQAVMVTATLAACGGSGSATSGNTVKILVTAPLSSPAFSIPQVLSGAKAAAASINASGGVEGKQIEIVSCNDQSNPNQASQCAQTAVAEQVSAVTGYFLFGPQIFDATKAAGIPVLDSRPVSPTAGTSPNSFPMNAGNFSIYPGIARRLVEKGNKNIVVVPVNNAAGNFNGKLAAQGVEAAGGTVVRTVNTPVGAPDYSPYVHQALEEGNTEAIIYVGTPEDFPKFVLAAKQAGFSGHIGATIGHVPPEIAKAIADSGITIFASSAYYLPPAPQAGLFASDMAKYEPASSVDVFSAGTWAAVNAVANALKGKPATDSKSLMAALSSSSALDVGAIMPKVDFTKAGPVADYPRLTNADIVVVQVVNGSYETADAFFDPFVR
ncbi:ABC transporter substrate-binding protein [Nocardia vinacea]|uniref:ABC transporter substrate-binding protein n=1 Tax=Nocardia vinacea TaxID=96468 RepID=A0ABZ1YXI6_9NOCA|nr:ABC transporter substrate-binding protein [Nocardia vinacea]